MNEIIKVNTDTQTVSARDLHETLDKITDFTKFFIAVSELKVSFMHDDLRTLSKVVMGFTDRFDISAIIYLSDSIDAESILPCKSEKMRKEKEKEIQEQIINNFSNIFPNYEYICSEKKIQGIGRIDIYASNGYQPVIIELKTGNKNPNNQLIAYGSVFKNPVLIGITEIEIPENLRINGIDYFTLEELKGRTPTWII